ncbi:hypothetical protein ASPWEDRAFT_42989 [Aspergillus wentii DTO 134E9]|uniref:Methyltransferase domain-containing protein n=1 Tax=Aspergillus wentii DTO 134E9 TaxID=1073089 RepID=A0A1L9RDF1_ASPWE|nr:uncharacterized protein ASPWEDRAFT_42989 [Aspergillus wentii DTO 134E9]KAI9933226.1 hypothetical protein MW887_007698 [Aspergillus wentii]OJJ32955.1 hypothetical protein ASPWEDRAFT_42989 [Aspergillus wentii DTO 134E9]
MPPKIPLPLSDEWTDSDAYVDTLVSFATSSDLFRHLCGGVHVLDFLTRDPDLYASLLPAEWRAFFDKHDIQDILDLLLREAVQPLRDQYEGTEGYNGENGWRGGPFPPAGLLDYIHQIRRLSLRRDFTPSEPKKPTLPRQISVGMNVKKYHEVAHFSKYVDSLCETVNQERGEPISHVVDFGSGQNYLGRTLASPPYNRHIIAIERKHQFISGAKGMDIHAKLAKKKLRLYNKKEEKCKNCKEPEPPAEKLKPVQDVPDSPATNLSGEDEDSTVINVFRDMDIDPEEMNSPPHRNDTNAKLAKAQEKTSAKSEEDQSNPTGAMSYIEHNIKDGYLEPIIKDVVESPPERIGAVNYQEKPIVSNGNEESKDANVMVISLHSCGNLLHHGVRSLTLNPSVKAIAMIGCCYNLVTERLGPATYKIPTLRSAHPRLSADATAYDPHGFPMSKRFEEYPHESGTGVKLNITARSMSLQAPYNWGRRDSEEFFTRHFYRSLLQRILVDRNIVEKPAIPTDLYEETKPDGSIAAGNPLIVGSLRKSAFTSFTSYVRAAVEKLSRDPNYGEKIQAEMGKISDEDLDRYLKDYWHTKKNLGVTWALMAYSASLVEALIVVDRWQFLREHDCVKDAWVEPVFDYGESPRNLAVIGIKK